MVSIATAGEILPPPPPPEIPKNTSSAFVPPEQLGAILGIIEENPIPPGKSDDVLGKIATADLSKEKIEEPKKETSDTKPEDKADTDTKAKEAWAIAERERIKQQLKEVGVLLLKARDSRASLVALSLAAGDTPMADEFRKQTLTMIGNGEKINTLTDEEWKTVQGNIPKTTESDDSPLKTFFVKHGYPEEIFETVKSDIATGVENAIHQTDKKGKPTSTANDLKQELGWTEKHPMPKTVEDLAHHIGDEAKNIEDMKAICTQAQLATNKQRLKDTFKTIKGNAPTYISFALMGTSFLSQMVQEAENPKGSH